VKIKKLFSSIFWYPISTKEKIDYYQEKIRELEWIAIKKFIPISSTFLDVGCGAGYSLIKAKEELLCEVQGIDPEPGAHGVGRFTLDLWKERPIIQGSAESLPFADNSFDVVYSSHVLEHVESETKALNEMKRVLKPGGVLIIGMPTASMSIVSLLSAWIFTTHISLYHCVFSLGNKDFFNRFIRVFLPSSHSAPRAKIITYDLIHYRISNWRKIVGKQFQITTILTPGLYPYPDYVQWFPIIKGTSFSSSVFFVCTKD
jgi:ubiquinone/menaquinone biosynthesis C-methylase UbiE